MGRSFKVLCARTFSAASLHKEQLFGSLLQMPALWHTEHFDGSGEGHGSPHSLTLRTCSALAASVCGLKITVNNIYRRFWHLLIAALY